jgi:hypothetical protein
MTSAFTPGNYGNRSPEDLDYRLGSDDRKRMTMAALSIGLRCVTQFRCLRNAHAVREVFQTMS